ncbi:hypothetical protein CsSME_00028148 [Camellia sinensis var. sinensis]
MFMSVITRFGHGKWTPELRSTYNLYDPVVRSTAQVGGQQCMHTLTIQECGI